MSEEINSPEVGSLDWVAMIQGGYAQLVAPVLNMVVQFANKASNAAAADAPDPEEVRAFMESAKNAFEIAYGATQMAEALQNDFRCSSEDEDEAS